MKLHQKNAPATEPLPAIFCAGDVAFSASRIALSFPGLILLSNVSVTKEVRSSVVAKVRGLSTVLVFMCYSLSLDQSCAECAKPGNDEDVPRPAGLSHPNFPPGYSTRISRVLPGAILGPPPTAGAGMRTQRLFI